MAIIESPTACADDAACGDGYCGDGDCREWCARRLYFDRRGCRHLQSEKFGENRGVMGREIVRQFVDVLVFEKQCFRDWPEIFCQFGIEAMNDHGIDSVCDKPFLRIEFLCR